MTVPANLRAGSSHTEKGVLPFAGTYLRPDAKPAGPRTQGKVFIFALKKPSLPDQSFGGLVSAWLAHTNDEACRELCTRRWRGGREMQGFGRFSSFLVIQD